jgi:hypothetical protein
VKRGGVVFFWFLLSLLPFCFLASRSFQSRVCVCVSDGRRRRNEVVLVVPLGFGSPWVGWFCEIDLVVSGIFLRNDLLPYFLAQGNDFFNRQTIWVVYVLYTIILGWSNHTYWSA